MGAGDRAAARRLATSALTLGSLVAAAVIAALICPARTRCCVLIGARGEALRVARLFLAITLPSNMLLAAGMLFTGLLRAVGEARQAMLVTLAGAIVTAGLDPLLIFGAGLGVEGAAITVCVARVDLRGGGPARGRAARPLGRPRLADLLADAAAAGGGRRAGRAHQPRALGGERLPGPRCFAGYGADAVAAAAVIDRLTPVAFGGLFALSGAIGPILAQNWGAGRFDRMRGVLREAVRVTLRLRGRGLAAAGARPRARWRPCSG